MLAYRLITRTEYPGLPLRVEYHLTPIGEKLASVIEQLRALETDTLALQRFSLSFARPSSWKAECDRQRSSGSDELGAGNASRQGLD